MDGKEIVTMDNDYIEKLEWVKSIAEKTEEEKVIRSLNITKDILKKRKALEGTNLIKLMCMDGVTQEERDAYDIDSDD